MRNPILRTAMAALAAVGAVDAACGLHICPRQEPADHSWQLGWTQGQSGFDIANTAGTYAEGVADIRYRHGRQWVADAHFPFLALSAGNHTAYGMGNPIALIEYRMHPGGGHMLGLGLQGEIPLGDHESGLAQEHFMLMPYASLSKAFAGFFLGGSSGVSKAIGHHHEAGMDMGSMEHAAQTATQSIGSPLYVHPHEDFEWSYRVSAGLAMQGGRFNPELSLSGQHVLSEPSQASDGDRFLSAGISAPIRVGRYVLTPEAAVPVSRARRFEWSASIGFGILL